MQGPLVPYCVESDGTQVPWKCKQRIFCKPGKLGPYVTANDHSIETNQSGPRRLFEAWTGTRTTPRIPVELRRTQIRPVRQRHGWCVGQNTGVEITFRAAQQHSCVSLAITTNATLLHTSLSAINEIKARGRERDSLRISNAAVTSKSRAIQPITRITIRTR